MYKLIKCFDSIDDARFEFSKLYSELKSHRVRINFSSKKELKMITEHCVIRFIVRKDGLRKYDDWYDAIFGFSYLESMIINKNKNMQLNPGVGLVKHILIRENYLKE